MKMRNTLFATLLLGLSGLSSADWQLDNSQSQLNLVTTKAVNIAEVHRFRQLDGAIANGVARVNINLNSIDTRIGIRDQRMRDMLFETARFPAATLTATIDHNSIDKLAVGQQIALKLSGQLALHGESKTVDLGPVRVTRLTGDRLQVASQQPAIINAGDFRLVAGVEKLRAAVGLPSISNAVPVTFVLVFEKGK